jgi:hypothetical protein
MGAGHERRPPSIIPTEALAALIPISISLPLACEAGPVLPAITARLLPGGHSIGHEFAALNPRRADRNLGSFKVRLAASRAGAWADFATGDHGSDIISLIAYEENIKQSEAARLLTRMLGVDLKGGRHA